MQATGERADAVYELAVVPHARGWSRPLRVAGALAVAALHLDMPRLSAGDCVVRRRSDGREVLRVGSDVGTQEHLLTQLATMTASEFSETWGISA